MISSGGPDFCRMWARRSPGMPTGILRKWLSDKGFGFITPFEDASGLGDLLAHIRQKSGPPDEIIMEGKRVTFEIDLDPQRGKPRTISWGLLEPAGYDGGGGGGSAASSMPPPPPAQVKHTQEEVEVPTQYLSEIMGQAGAGLEEIKQRVGGNISMELAPSENAAMRTVKIRGPAVNASQGALLMLQRVAELVA